FNRLRPCFGNNVSANLAFAFAVPFEQAKNGLLTSAARAPLNRLAAAIRVHVPRESTDIGFVHFDRFAFSAHLVKSALGHRETNSVPHKPSRSLFDSNSAANLIRGNSILCSTDQPYGRKPFR